MRPTVVAAIPCNTHCHGGQFWRYDIRPVSLIKLTSCFHPKNVLQWRIMKFSVVLSIVVPHNCCLRRVNSHLKMPIPPTLAVPVHPTLVMLFATNPLHTPPQQSVPGGLFKLA